MPSTSITLSRLPAVPSLVIYFLATFSLSCGLLGAETVSIAAAADLQYCLGDLNKAFEASTPGAELKVATGSSGNFSTQIANGAPFDVFLSADALYPENLVKAGQADGTTRLTYAFGKIVLWTLHPDQVPVDQGLQILKDEKAVRRIAVANPDHAPYGRAARAALQKAGLWDEIQKRIVLGDNIAQTAQFVDSGNAEAGIVALSLVLSPALKGKGAFAEIDPSTYPPLEQVVILTKHGSENQTARKYIQFLGTPEAIAIFDKFGFTRKAHH